MNGKNLIYAVVLLILAAFLSVGVSLSIGNNLQRDPLEVQAAQLYRQIRCPVCEGQTIADSDAGPSPQMRFEVRTMLQEGYTPVEIKHHFARAYGDWILTEPPTRGAYVISWWLPALFLMAACAWLWQFLRGKTKSGSYRDGDPGEESIGRRHRSETQQRTETETDFAPEPELEQQLHRYL